MMIRLEAKYMPEFILVAIFNIVCNLNIYILFLKYYLA
jgi:hypothetical protein